MKDKLISFFSRFKLMIVDILIISASWELVTLVSHTSISSMDLNGRFSFVKYLMFAGCLVLFRTLNGIYGSIWRYANTGSYLRLLLADMSAGAVFYVIGRFDRRYSIGFAYSLLILMVNYVATTTSRYIYQMLYAYVGRVKDRNSDAYSKNRINIAIVGAGNVGASLASSLIRNPASHYNPYCFIDKDNNKSGNRLNGIKVYKEDDNIIETIKNMPVQEIIIAIPDASTELKSRLYDYYKQTGCKVKLYDYPVNGSIKGKKRALREFSIEDLLFREEIKVDRDKNSKFFGNKTILVTGGGGSIGSELCRQIAMLNPKRLIILDIYENNAYEIEQELIRKYGREIDLKTYIASVRDEKRIDEIFAAERPDIVFHAAAHKHVPLMENNSCEAIKNNVFGTYTVANMSEKYGVHKFILISTDKAVNPTNVMGASKRMCEMIIQCRNDNRYKTEFAAVRFGNVLGSNGSVIPLFKRQIEAGGPVTVTDKRIIRYFMTIPEAVGLVMEAGAIAKNGELFVLDMGKPVKILDLAENMIRLSGYIPYKDIDIVEVGLRPGEKLYEELLMKNENLDKTDNEMIFIEKDKPYTREEIENKLKIFHAIFNHDSTDAYYESVIKAVKATIPTYHRPEEVNRNAEQSAEMQVVCEAAATAE